MSTFELTVRFDYTEDWGVWEGVRELIQNAHDAEVVYGHEMEVAYRPSTSVLTITSKGVGLTPDTLLMGGGDKRDNEDAIGRWGEGYKLGLLALLRENRQVTIGNQKNTWKPVIAHSTRYNAPVLMIKEHKGARKKNDDLIFKIEGISRDDWQTILTRILFLRIVEKSNYIVRAALDREWWEQNPDFVKGHRGVILKDESYAGQIYHRGIWVCEMQGDSETEMWSYGFSVSRMKLDRDRRLVDRWDLDWQISGLWNDTLIERPEEVVAYMDLLTTGSPDVGRINEYTSVPEQAVEKMVTEFKEKHGALAVPCTNEEQAEKLEHVGLRGIAVNEKLASVLQRQMGTPDQARRKRVQTEARKVPLDELTSREKFIFETALSIVGQTTVLFDPANVGVYEYMDKDMLGRYIGKTRSIEIAKGELRSLSACLSTLIHEFAHEYGIAGDGRLGHVHAMAFLWERVFNQVAAGGPYEAFLAEE